MEQYLGIFNVDGKRKDWYFNAKNDEKSKDEAELWREEIAKYERKKQEKVILFGVFRIIWKDRTKNDFVLKEIK
ncbi:unnamed protein product [marine sediment metagenome]|uniref:Uncharacterized protein n=1 Tax=marine sediment metagenome TaxID=412755 RepID=X0YJH4_9ZZZZ